MMVMLRCQLGGKMDFENLQTGKLLHPKNLTPVACTVFSTSVLLHFGHLNLFSLSWSKCCILTDSFGRELIERNSMIALHSSSEIISGKRR